MYTCVSLLFASNTERRVFAMCMQAMRDVSVETFLEYLRTSNVEAIEAAVRQSGYDIDTQDDVSVHHHTMH